MKILALCLLIIYNIVKENIKGENSYGEKQEE